MTVIFNNEKFKDEISTYLKVVDRLPTSNFVEEQRNKFIQIILRQMIADGESWDEKTPFNKKYISKALKTRISDADASKDSIDAMYTILLRFFIEEYLNNPIDDSSLYQDIRDFSLVNMDSFSNTGPSQIRYAIYEMSTSIFRDLLNSKELATLKSIADAKESTEQLHEKWRFEIDKQKEKIDEAKLEWRSDLNESEERVRQLQETLTHQKNAFNFVGLYRGFESLGEIKQKQLFWARLILIALGSLIPLLIITESFVIYFKEQGFKNAYELVSLIPGISLALILIYYFRVALGNYNSIRAQIMQIDLRKSLCQFIQSYAEYSSGIKLKDGNLLDKFEDVIFSNIMPSEDKIPSTFDGIEQVVKLVAALKGK